MPNESRHKLAPSIESISRLIADIRLHRKLTQRDLARLAGVSQPWISAVERGSARMDLPAVLRVLEALNVHITLEVEEGPSGAGAIGARRTER